MRPVGRMTCSANTPPVCSISQLPGRCRDEHRLGPHRVPFVEPQRPVVDAARQAETIFGERDLAAVIALRHRADLRHGLVALIDEQQCVLGQIFEQCRRRLARQAARQEARIVLDPRAAARRMRSSRDRNWSAARAAGLEQFALGLELLQTLGQLVTDRLGRLLERRARRHVMRIGINADAVEVGDGLARQRIELGDRLDLVAEEADTPRGVLVMRREDFEAVAADAKLPRWKAASLRLYCNATSLRIIS